MFVEHSLASPGSAHDIIKYMTFIYILFLKHKVIYRIDDCFAALAFCVFAIANREASTGVPDRGLSVVVVVVIVCVHRSVGWSLQG